MKKNNSFPNVSIFKTGNMETFGNIKIFSFHNLYNPPDLLSFYKMRVKKR